MSVVFPLTIYFDASCPLCASEMAALKARDRNGRLHLIDCSSVAFADAAVEQAGLSRADLMRIIHARDAQGQWLSGVAVFATAYGAVGLRTLAALWSHPRLRPLWVRAYPWIARHRMLLSRLGATAFIRVIIGAFGAPSACISGTCSNPRTSR